MCPFDLDFGTSDFVSMALKQIIYFRMACGIPDPDNEEFIITGGEHNSGKTVSVYKKSGWDRDLANLNQGRDRHACARYLSGDTAVINL